MHLSQLSRLQNGLSLQNVNLADEPQIKLLAYLELLKKWNHTYNLTALRDEGLMMSHHVFDSLSVLPFLKTIKTLIDVGSGGGMPGIPIAIARPDIKVTLLDANSKKTSFLQQAVIELNLENVSVVTGRVEVIEGRIYDVVTSRAFAELKDFISVTKQLLDSNGMWLAMKGVYPYEEIAQLQQDVDVLSVDKVNVAELDAERHIISMKLQG